MKEYELFEIGKIPTDLFGDLFIKTTILEYEYPRCFIANDSNNVFFALLENECDDDNFGWNLTKVTLDDINNVNRGTKNVQSLFIDKESYLLQFLNNQNLGQIKKVNLFEGKYEIRGDLFIKDFCEIDELFDYHMLQKISNDKSVASISLVLDSESASKTSTVFKAINYIKNICGNLKKKLDIFDSVLSVQHASTVITFQFDNKLDNSLFTDQLEVDKDISGVIELGNFLSANEPEEVCTEIENVNALKKYSKLIDIFNKEEKLRPKLVLAIPNREKVASFGFSSESCIKKKRIVSAANDMYEQKNKIEERKIHIDGILTGILTGDKNQFSFKGNDKINYNGTVDFSMVGNDNQFLVNGVIYSAVINESCVYNNDKCIKKSYKLLSLKEKEKIIKYKKIGLF